MGADVPILVSFVFLDGFLKTRNPMFYRDWSMDCGAYSAWKSGTKIDLNRYIEVCRELLLTDKKLVEVFALDVIGDWRASLKNTEKMWGAGVPAIPCFHHGEPWDTLMHLAKNYPKIALGGTGSISSNEKKLEYAKQCFACVWPKRIHGFAFCSRDAIFSLPFESVDSTNWTWGARYGMWLSYNNEYLRIRGARARELIGAEIAHYMDIEREARAFWQTKKNVASFFGATLSPTVRIAINGSSDFNQAVLGGLRRGSL